jgi:hypothetical protein
MTRDAHGLHGNRDNFASATIGVNEAPELRANPALWVGRKRFSDPHCSDDLIFRRIEPEPELQARLSHGSPRDHLPNHGQMASVGFGAMCSWGNSVCLRFGGFIAGIVPAELGSELVAEGIASSSPCLSGTALLKSDLNWKDVIRPMLDSREQLHAAAY